MQVDSDQVYDDEPIIEADENLDEPEELEGHEDDQDSEDKEQEVVEDKVPAKKSKYVEFTTPEQKERVGQLTREKYEAIRKAQELERKLQQYEKEPEAPKEVPVPTADPVTDQELYLAQLRQREQYVRELAKHENETQARQQQKQAAEQARQEALVSTYKQNMERLQIDSNQLAKAADVVEKFNLSKDLIDHLLEDEDGPAIVAYLGDNIDDLAEIASMKTNKAVSYIERSIRGKLARKKAPNTPPPSTKVSGTRKPSVSKESWTIE